MTGNTTIRRALIHAILMALRTAQVLVFPNQRETGVIVIESCIRPSARVMARAAVRAKLTVMLILGRVAGKTILRRAFIDPIRMASAAQNTGMLT